MKMIKQFFSDESGATMVEYAIIVALIAIAVAVTVYAVSTELRTVFGKVVTCLKSADGSACGT